VCRVGADNPPGPHVQPRLLCEALFLLRSPGPGYGLYRQLRALGQDCIVVAPSLIPSWPGERVKTNRRDAVSLARLLRANELTPVWVPDETHEAVRDLARTRCAAVADYRRSCHRSCCATPAAISGEPTWRGRHLRWLDGQNFAHPAQRLAFQEMLNSVREKRGQAGSALKCAPNSCGLSKLATMRAGLSVTTFLQDGR
jgi:transposase